MRTRIVLCICITLLLMASVASATTVWNPVANGIFPPATGDWGDAANWTNGLPDAVEKAVFNVPGAAECVVTDAQSTRYFVLGDGDDGGVVRVQNGGILSQTEPHWAGVGYDSTAHMIVETGGVVNFSEHMWIGLKAGSVGTLDINGGTVNVAQMIGLGWEGTGGIGYVNVNDGLLALSNIHGDGASSIKGVSVLDIGLGSVTLPGDSTSVIGVYVAAGKITGFGGIGTLDVVFADGVTTVTAVHPLKPFPTNDSLVSPGDVELSWTLLDPCVPGEPVPVDVYFTDNYDALQQFTDPAAIRVVNKQNVTSVVVQTQPKTRYYWAVDTYIGDPNDPVFGPIFSFVADNLPPTVDAGANVVTWLADDGPRTGNLDATVTDDEAYTVQWTVVSEPNEGMAVLSDASAEDTAVTLSASGEYVLKLEANDGEYTGSDTVTINVYNDSCEAAKSLPDFEPLPGDINEDCIVNIMDIVILIEHWLQDNSLTEEWFKVD
jgi:hypothetical protein